MVPIRNDVCLLLLSFQVGPNVCVLGTVSASPHASAAKEVAKLLIAQPDYDDDNDDNSPVFGASISDSDGDNVKASKKRKGDANGTIGDSDMHKADWQAAKISAESDVHTVAVAVRQGNILATAFHPELTDDLRWHRYTVQYYT